MSVTRPSASALPAMSPSGRQSGEAAADEQQRGGLRNRRGWCNAKYRCAAARHRAGNIGNGQRVRTGSKSHDEPTVERVSERAADVVPTVSAVGRGGRKTQRHEVIEQLERIARDKEVETVDVFMAASRDR